AKSAGQCLRNLTVDMCSYGCKTCRPVLEGWSSRVLVVKSDPVNEPSRSGPGNGATFVGDSPFRVSSMGRTSHPARPASPLPFWERNSGHPTGANEITNDRTRRLRLALALS